MGADNQQERLNYHWFAGFVDGEGCFHIAINNNQKMKSSFQVLPEFRLVQHERDVALLHYISQQLCSGVVRKNHGERYELRIRKNSELLLLAAKTNRQKNRNLVSSETIRQTQLLHNCDDIVRPA